MGNSGPIAHKVLCEMGDWTREVQLLLKEIHTSISKEHIAACDFPVGVWIRACTAAKTTKETV